MFTREPLFPGEHYLKQLDLIIDLIGSPTSEDLEFIQNQKAKDFIAHRPLREKRELSTLVPGEDKDGLFIFYVYISLLNKQKTNFTS